MGMVLERNLFKDGARCIGSYSSQHQESLRPHVHGDVSCHVRLPFSSQGQFCNWHVRLP